MQAELQRVLDLQSAWTSTRSQTMDERGRLVRNDAAAWLYDHRAELVEAIGIGEDDLLTEGRDGTGLKTRVPWTRFGSALRSPHATEGFYVVYLWAFDGSAVFLSLNQGTTEFVNGQFVRRPIDVLESRVDFGQDAIADWISSRHDLAPPILHDVGDNSLGRGYELGNIAAIRYESGAIPGETDLLLDAVEFGRVLGELYREAENIPLPDEVPEVISVEEATDEAAGKSRRRGAGFRQSKEERDLIEKHAENMAADFYAKDGWQVRRKGRPFDLDLTRDGERLTVEVKGTTSQGEAIILTGNEVAHHDTAYPANALVVVRGIVLDRSTSPPTVSGGELFELKPWVIDPGTLKVVSYKYSVPEALYEDVDQ
jgi:5-methylcytosine-specific restriction enzyme MrcB-like protein/uncharacterized protein DUF3883